MIDKDTEVSHESFGMMSFSRIQTRGAVLHGSDLKHNTIILMRIYHSVKRRKYGCDWHQAKGLVVEAEMSQNQFSELITSMNIGDGIPVTLKHTERDGMMENPEFASVIEQNRGEFKEKTEEVVQNAETLLTNMKILLRKSGTLKKADRNDLISDMEKIVREIGSDMPFMEECFEKSMDSAVTDAKGTIEAFYQQRVVEAGLDVLDKGKVEAPCLKYTDGE